MHRRHWLLWLLLLGLAAVPASGADVECPPGTERKGAPPPDGRKVWCQLPDGTQQGPSLSYYEDGTRLAEANFEAGELHGAYREWFSNGQTSLEVRYAHGKKDGVERRFYEDGKKMSEGRYEEGLREGPYHEWHPNEQEALASAYVDGVVHGEAKTWYESGQMRSEGSFEMGDYVGSWVGWYEDGSVEKEAVFDGGDEVSRKGYAPGEKP